LNQFARVRPRNGGPQYAPAGAGDDLYEPLGRALGLGAVIVVEGPAQDAHGVAVLLACLGLARAHVGELGIGVGRPRHQPAIEPSRGAEERATDEKRGLVAGHVGEGIEPVTVADRPDAPVGGAQAIVDLNAAPGEADAGGLQTQRLDVGRTTRRDQQMRTFEPFAARQLDRDTGAVARHTLDRRTLAQHDTVAGEPRGHDRDQLRVVLGEARRGLQYSNATAEPAMRLGHLESNRSAADHNEMLGPHAVGEHRLVGKERHLGQTRHGRRHRTRTGGDHEPARGNRESARADFAGALEARFCSDDAHAELLEPLDRIVRRDRSNHAGDVIHHGGEVDLGLDGRDAERGAVALRLRGLGGGDQRFRRHAPIVEAIAAHPAAFDQHDIEAKLSGASGNHQSAGATAYNA